MNIDYSKFENIQSFNKNTKQKLISFNGLIKKNKIKTIHKSLNESLKVPTKIFKHNNKIVKYEFNDFSKFNSTFKKLYKELNSQHFLNILKKIFNVNKLYSDKRNFYSGISVSNKNSKLNEHIDFNYNNKLKRYRYINLLLYLNKNFKKNDGGKFYYRDYKTRKKKYIDPLLNNAVIFGTNKNIPHGFTTVKKKRISFNLYYYTNQNLSLLKKKHKTYWK